MDTSKLLPTLMVQQTLHQHTPLSFAVEWQWYKHLCPPEIKSPLEDLTKLVDLGKTRKKNHDLIGWVDRNLAVASMVNKRFSCAIVVIRDHNLRYHV